MSWFLKVIIIRSRIWLLHLVRKDVCLVLILKEKPGYLIIVSQCHENINKNKTIFFRTKSWPYNYFFYCIVMALSITVLILLSCVWQEDNRIFPKLASISVKNRNKYQDIPFCHNVFFILMETSIIVTVYKQERMNHLFAT